ncbi:hypothetical protein [Oceaniovalibus sp. ACAM 378]|uniref:hypothetical protein n=1 Tax=Oceaniovalibus sp. ACAM 378 TaxID=2599923 RepID=UPI0011D5CC9C|nr:hypothetical protein [Oceaniovalibus sp. ACAM 378]TYB83908.1 hypothetical protein FQ320_23675 [Oceaniovalibus sp. ACAM 378]
MASVGSAEADRQEVAVEGSRASYRIGDFSKLSLSTAGAFGPLAHVPADTQAVGLNAQLDALELCLKCMPHPLAILREALCVQWLIEAMLVGKA